MFRRKQRQSGSLEERVRAALGTPDWLQGVRVQDGGRVTLILEGDPGDLEGSEARRIEAEARAMNVADITEVRAMLTAERPAGSAPQAAAPAAHGPPSPTHSAPKPGQRRVSKGARLSDEAITQGQPGQPTTDRIPGISRILVVASAKGGVGKSTVAVNLAAAFAKLGLKTGLLDADIYGPSAPTMLGTGDASPETDPAGKLIPVEAHGIHSLSIGYLSDPDAPMIWRGPIVMSAITQMLNDAAWGTPEDPLDLLIIDTPPGTGDAQLAIAQKVPVTAAVLVTTPQEVALADVRRGAAMFAKTAVPVLGIIETMSWFEDPAGNRHYLMGKGGGKGIADALGLPLLGQLPILQDIREGGDTGQPAALGTGPAASLFHEISRSVALNLDSLQTKTPPKIIFED
ncbi:MAG TPA: ATP-binding protein [Henriciella marina]|uniref:Mrp/NBP35 family ATP-binding protein n=1 Tax=Henriciella sp. TaxID=1968823 RepID=UPI0017F815F2|nr:Mrp/NBP35 family ATP-binding protein [Henriciella sp.]HIG20936.1 ATP-binding protein [Henriciella sp.]HIK64351.1 ATP-binding protein [Henriciella marina]